MDDDGDIDYSGYTLRELEEALAGIDRKRYPRNYVRLSTVYRKLAGRFPEESIKDDSVAPQTEAGRPLEARYDAGGRYVPNEIAGMERIQNIVFSLLLFAYGGIGVWINDLYIPSKRHGIHLHDVPAWIMYTAMICASVVMLSVVVDHYDRRDNERHYRAFAEVGKYIGWALFGASLFWGLFSGGHA